jgi:hypothetical protein
MAAFTPRRRRTSRTRRKPKVAPRGIARTSRSKVKEVQCSRIFAAMALVLAFSLCLSAPAFAGGEPEAPITEACHGSIFTPGKICGTLNPSGKGTVGFYFTYNKGAVCTGGLKTPLEPEAEVQDKEVSAELTGLEPNTQYTYCLVATNQSGETYGAAVTFKTEPAAPTIEEESLKKLSEEHARLIAEEAAVGKKHEEEAAAKKSREEAASVGSVSLNGSAIDIQSSGEATVKLTCAGTGTCSGKLTLTAKSTTKGKKTKTIGTATFSISADETATVRLMLNASGRVLLSADRGRLSASLTVLKSSPVPSQTHTEKVHLVQQKPRRGGSRG